MEIAKVVVGVLVVTIASALAATYSRSALVFAFLASGSVLALIYARDIFSAKYAVQAMYVLAALAGASSACGVLYALLHGAYTQSTPAAGLSLDVDQVRLSDVTSPQGEQIVLLSLVASVRNSGAPTVAEGFSATITLQDNTEISTEPIVLPSKMTLSAPGWNEEIFGEDALYAKTLNPIVSGSVVRGRLLFFIRGWSNADLNKRLAGASIAVHFMDGAKNVLTANVTTLRRGDDNIQYPGLRYDNPPAAH